MSKMESLSYNQAAAKTGIRAVVFYGKWVDQSTGFFNLARQLYFLADGLHAFDCMMLNALRSVAEIEKEVTHTSSVPVERFVASSHEAFSALKEARLLAECASDPLTLAKAMHEFGNALQVMTEMLSQISSSSFKAQDALHKQRHQPLRQ